MFFLRKTLFSNVTEKWLLYKKFSIKQSTYYRYNYIVNKYINSYFKGKKVSFFENYDFNKYVEYLSKNLSSKTVSDIVIVFKSILKYINTNYNTNYNLNLIAIPKQKKKETKILNEREIEKLEKFCVNTHNARYIGIVICLNTGLRIGEICCLKWKDINLKEKIIVVNKTVQRIYKGKNKTEMQIGEPKTDSSTRKIPISNKLMHILKKLKQINNISDEMYFLTGTTKIFEPRNYYAFYKKILNLCNIQNYNFHVLRHTFASNCIKIGMDAKSLSELLGHSDVNITLNRYVHSSYSIKKKFLDKL